MAVQQGMKVDQVAEIAASLKTQAAELGEIKASSDTQVHKLLSNWFGPDATDFQHQWNSHKKAFHAAEQMLQKMSKDLHEDVTEQRNASKK